MQRRGQNRNRRPESQIDPRRKLLIWNPQHPVPSSPLLQFAQQFTPDFLTPAAPFDSVNNGSHTAQPIGFDRANGTSEPTNNPEEQCLIQSLR
jgi:hypothetical protein